MRDHCLYLHAQRAARAQARRFDAALLAMDRTTLTAALKPLERSGLVASVANPADRRSRRLALTDAGRDLLAQALPAWTRTHAEVDRRLAGDGAGLRTALRALARASGAPGAPGALTLP